jgi:N-acetyl-anhydromuramyl-L-alanine amidase AmpD
MAGTLVGTRQWFQNPDSKVSAHYGVGKDGSIDKYVPTTSAAWHCGIVANPTAQIYKDNAPANPNDYMVGIEHEGQTGDVMPEAQYQATLWLHRRLSQAYNIPVDRYHIIGHCELDSRPSDQGGRAQCPGSGFPWDRLMADLTTIDDVVG